MSVDKAAPATAATKVTKPAKQAKSAAIMIGDLYGTKYDWKGGVSSYSSGIWNFSATSSTNPGFHVDNPGKNGTIALEGKRTLKFSVKGRVSRERSYAVLMVQVFGQPVKRKFWQALSNTCEVNLRIPNMNENAYTELSLDLSSLKNVNKVLVMLVTDKGSCSVQLKDLRIE